MQIHLLLHVAVHDVAWCAQRTVYLQCSSPRFRVLLGLEPFIVALVGAEYAGRARYLMWYMVLQILNTVGSSPVHLQQGEVRCPLVLEYQIVLLDVDRTSRFISRDAKVVMDHSILGPAHVAL